MKVIVFKQNEFEIRKTTKDDASLILSYIKKIAAYEKLSDRVVATLKDIEHTIFEEKQAFVLIAEKNGKPIGFMLYFLTYSTFLGRANLYLEDIYIDLEYRHQGYGKLMFKALASLAVEKGYYRIDWMCLDWNTKSIDFYKSLGAKHLEQWYTFRLEKEEIEVLSKL
ncbi:GNAT family N-acetyltransferase [Mariniplasma anaerobium]|uniref:N-acetyltransferase n=1 Tax=Mariniplasma anaerobium TaxID=2735436 RepID=A0A7U9XWU8_9MOLU|nr:GNAT family N-acetyltransferase [Mariniplasma anaerobium]BCR36774.1 N-acetyltransferase [Mariniplasma anaerobium]